MGILSELEERRSALIEAWEDAVLQAYPEQTGRFLREVKDPFSNPVGATLRENLPVVFDVLLGRSAEDRSEESLDRIVRLRAVQDFTAGQAVGFVFLLKRILRRELAEAARADADGWARIEDEIDGLAVRAFEAFVRCREKIFEIKADEARRRVFVLERRYAAAPPDPEGEGEVK
ncbi:MAG: RsbRD N-terminal domain-containing protein [Acidobacteriota bacterium]